MGHGLATAMLEITRPGISVCAVAMCTVNLLIHGSGPGNLSSLKLPNLDPWSEGFILPLYLGC